MVNQYLPLVLFFIAVIGFFTTMIILSIALGPKKITPTKQSPFECGSIPVQDVKNSRFSVLFYLIAMLFIVFDIEVIFLYPWALVLDQLSWLAFFEMVTFVFILALGLIYIWAKGILDWNKL